MSIPNTSPTFTATLAVGKAVAATANTDLTGGTTTNVVTVYTAVAGGNGSQIDRIVCIPTATCVAGLIRLFLHDGSTLYPFKEVAISAGTVNATTASPVAEVVRSDGLPVCILPAGWSLKAATTITQNVQVLCFGGDY